MADALATISVDAVSALGALGRFSTFVQGRYLKPAAKITADAIAREAKRRVARGETGKTAEGIRVEEDRARVGYVVLSTRQQQYNLPIWLEKGTKHMRARPYMFVSAELEANAHDRRMRQAVADAIADAGLGA